MKIAIIGSGIAGLSAAYLLQRRHDVTVYEADHRIGGHTATVDVTLQGQSYAVDTGFIVYNDRTYPNFIRLLDELGVSSQPTDMSFAVRNMTSGLEYAGSNINTLFGQRRNALRPSFLRMLADIVRFNRDAQRDLDDGVLSPSTTLREYLATKQYSALFASDYLVPMGAAIWSCGTDTIWQFPIQFFLQFFRNHGLLDIHNRPQWYVLQGGSRSYLAPLTAGFSGSIRTDCAVEQVQRNSRGVNVIARGGQCEEYDQVVFACHSDQALNILDDASSAERDILGAIAYQPNDVILHTDSSVLPSRQRVWSSWNAVVDGSLSQLPQLTYNMNILQGIDAPETFCVTLNQYEDIDPAKILRRFRYSHPVFSLAGSAAQARWQEINGLRRSWFCGAYWHNGFHEDGVSSAIRVAERLGVEW